MSSVGFEPIIPAIDRPQTHALDRSATGTDRNPEVNQYNVTDDVTEELKHKNGRQCHCRHKLQVVRRYCDEEKLTDFGGFTLPDIITAVRELDHEGKQLPSVQQNVAQAATSKAIRNAQNRITY